MVVINLRAKLFILIEHHFFSKLHRIGVRGSLRWFISYLSNRKQTVSINGKLNGPVEVNYGAAQGNCILVHLDPYIFNLRKQF